MAAYEPKPRPSLFDDGEASIMNQIDELLDGPALSTSEPSLAELAFTAPAQPDSVPVEPAPVEPAHTEPAHTEPVAAAPQLVEPVAAASQLVEPVAAASPSVEDVDPVSVAAGSSAVAVSSGTTKNWLLRAGIAVVVLMVLRRAIRHR